MAKYGLRWMDSDMHLCEPIDLWDKYIDRKFRDMAPRWTGDMGKHHLLGNRAGAYVLPWEGDRNGHPYQVTDRIREQRFAVFAPYLTADRTHVDTDGQMRAMDAEGIDAAVLFPTLGQFFQNERVPKGLDLALARAYNDWLYDFCRINPQRLKLHALVPITDVAAAVEEIRRAVTKLGAVSIGPGTGRRDVRLDNPIYDPIWKECEELGVAVGFHGSQQVHLRERYKDSVLMGHANGRILEHMLAFMELLFGGMFERHPKLRCAFLEVGCSWVPYWLFRLEEHWEIFYKAEPELPKNVTMPPIEYWKRQCYTAVEADEWCLPGVIASIGDDNLVVSSDFPHFDSPFPEAFDRFMKIPNVSRESKAKILWDNTAKLYNLN